METEALQQLFESYKEKKGFSGAVLIKTAEETLFSFTSGYANRMYQINNTLDTSFDTASITKLFTAAGIVLLESKGKISFEDKIHSIIDLSGTKIPKDVRIKHLLTHTSGIADDAEEEKGEDYADLFKNSPNYCIRENKDFIKNFAYKEPNFRTGNKICYNNCAFVLLGLAIEQITGRGYREFITEEIFKPFHMNHTFFASKEDSNRIFAEGYFYDMYDDLKKNIYSFPPIGTADSGAYTTVKDLDVFIRKIHSSNVYRKMLLPQTDIKIPKEDYLYTMAFAFELREKDEEIIRIHKDGANAGVCNITVFYPKDDITFSILGNVDCNIWELHSKAEKILFPQL
jgi:CubicO group peptidase (beta-lactamase class C family)